MSSQTAPAAVQRAEREAQSTAARAPRPGLFARIPAPWLFAGFITLILVVGETIAGILGGDERLPLALGTAIAFEVVLSRIFRRSWPHPLSSYITGNSVASTNSSLSSA